MVQNARDLDLSREQAKEQLQHNRQFLRKQKA